MALEKIEEDLGLLVVLRDAVNFYSSYLQERKKARELAIEEIADDVTQVAQMSQQKEKAEEELGALQEEQDRIDSEFQSIAPYVQLLSKIGTIKDEIAKRQQKLREKEDALVMQEKIAKSKPDDEIVQERLIRDQAIFCGEKTNEDIVLQRLDRDLAGYLQRLGEDGVNTKELEKQAQAVQGRLQSITNTIADKAQKITNMDDFIQSHQEKVARLEELKEDLSKHEADLVNITEVARFVSEVPFNEPTTPTEHTG